MPKAIKKRVERKTGLKEEDVKGSLQHTLDVIKQRKRILMYALSVLGIVVVLAVSFLLYSGSQKQKAYSFESEAYDYYYESLVSLPLSEEERWEKALELFQKSLDTKPTPTAMFYLGNCYFNLADYDNAIKTYNEFVRIYAGDEVILPLVYQKLASAYLKNGQDDDALKTLDALAQYKSGIFRDAAFIIQARHYERSGNKEEALARYTEIVQNFSTSPWVTEAKAKIEQDKASETVVEETSEAITPLPPAEQSTEENQ
jgi:tetratricopeptide (TPR) repeat protein